MKQKIKIQIVNPEALEIASINKTRVLVDIFFDRLAAKEMEAGSAPKEVTKTVS